MCQNQIFAAVPSSADDDGGGDREPAVRWTAFRSYE